MKRSFACDVCKGDWLSSGTRSTSEFHVCQKHKSQLHHFSLPPPFCFMVGRRWDRGQPALYNLTSELIWPEVICRARSHPHEVTWRDNDGLTALHHSCRFEYTVDVVQAMLTTDQAAACIQDKSGSTPLHVACWSGSVDNIRLLIEASRDAASVADNRGRTPLHLACSTFPTPSPDTIELLLEASPEVSMATDHNGKTPLSNLCDRHQQRLQLGIDLAKCGKDREEVMEKTLRPFWTHLRLLLRANAKERFSSEENWRLVHVLTTIPNCPPILFQLALALHPDQVKEKICGSLPLHLAAECPTASIDAIQRDGFYVSKLVDLFPMAAQIVDSLGRLPVHIAIENGKSWEGVVRKLVAKFPSAIIRMDGKHYLYPFLLAALASPRDKDEQLNCILELLRADPSTIMVAL